MSAYTDASAWYAPEGGGYRTTAPLEWHVGREGGPVVVVPPGFPFEVSTPPGLRWAADPHDPRYLKAAALHDWCLADGWDSVSAAAVFWTALEADGVGLARRVAMFLAVTVGRAVVSWVSF